MASESSPVGVGIVGYGFAGRGFHAYLAGLEPRLKVVAIATRDEGRRQRAASETGARTYATLDEMLRDDEVRLVILATPHDVHEAQAIQTLEAGRHCVVDKVMCLSTAEADRMIAARDRSGRMLSVFHNRRWDGDYLTLRRLLENGALGRLRMTEMGIWRYGPSGGWRGDRARAGSLLHDWGAHLVDQSLLLFEAPVVSVTAYAQEDWPGVDLESFLSTTLHFADGGVARIECHYQAQLGKPKVLAVGDRGAYMKHGVDPQEAAMLRGDIGAAREDPANYGRLRTTALGVTGETVVETVRGDWTGYYRNIADHLVEGAPLAVTAEQVRRQIAVFDATLESIRRGETVRFETPV
jgi:scyllo-inositol 2-dehydrogenase (NADP+)